MKRIVHAGNSIQSGDLIVLRTMTVMSKVMRTVKRTVMKDSDEYSDEYSDE